MGIFEKFTARLKKLTEPSEAAPGSGAAEPDRPEPAAAQRTPVGAEEQRQDKPDPPARPEASSTPEGSST